MTAAELFKAGRYQDVAGQIDASSLSPATARVLTVFNPHARPFTGIVVFSVSMKWLEGRVLPPIRVYDPLTLTDAPHRLDDMRREENRIAFGLVFSVAAVPAHGYKSYIAEYAAASGPTLATGIASTECAVVETVPHPGVLPLMLSFG
jgi:hypothetical protein